MARKRPTGSTQDKLNQITDAYELSLKSSPGFIKLDAGEGESDVPFIDEYNAGILNQDIEDPTSYDPKTGLHSATDLTVLDNPVQIINKHGNDPQRVLRKDIDPKILNLVRQSRAARAVKEQEDPYFGVIPPPSAKKKK